MKRKIIFAVLIIVAGAFSSCAPKKIKVLGTGTVEYDTRGDIYFVRIDSMTYPIETIVAPTEDYDKIGNVVPEKGTLVTVFTSSKGIKAVIGSKTSPEEITAIYKENQKGFWKAIGTYFIVYLLIVVIIFAIIGVVRAIITVRHL